MSLSIEDHLIRLANRDSNGDLEYRLLGVREVLDRLIAREHHLSVERSMQRSINTGRLVLKTCARCGEVGYVGRKGGLSCAGCSKKIKMLRSQLSHNRARRVFELDDYTCRLCGAVDDLEVDHVVPLARGGGNDLANLQTLCGRCNRLKGANL